MKLTQEQINELISRLNSFSYSQGIKCPICGGNNWTLNDLIIESREFQNGNLIIGGESHVVPFVSITCKKCSHTLFFNAIQLGIIKPDTKDEKQQTTE